MTEKSPEQKRRDLLEHHLLMDFGRCCRDFGLVEHDDLVLCAMSGGKDSFTMIHLLQKMQKRTPFVFRIEVVTIDQGQPGFSADSVREYAQIHKLPFHFVKQDVYSLLREKIPEGKSFCPLCSRMRRGILYRVAREMGATKIALGHHREDTIETLLLNILYSGQTKAMPPRLVTDDAKHVVIRPMSYLPESDIIEFSKLMGFPFVTCTDCGHKTDLHREKIKRLLEDLSDENPKVRGNLLAALSNVVPGHLLDRNLLADLGKPVPSIRKGRTRKSYEKEAEGRKKNE